MASSAHDSGEYKMGGSSANGLVGRNALYTSGVAGDIWLVKLLERLASSVLQGICELLLSCPG